MEDEESVRTLTRSLLEEGGYTVIEASNGTHALEVAGRHSGPIHLLLTDVVMPGMNGRVLAQKMIETQPKDEGDLHIRLHGQLFLSWGTFRCGSNPRPKAVFSGNVAREVA